MGKKKRKKKKLLHTGNGVRFSIHPVHTPIFKLNLEPRMFLKHFRGKLTIFWCLI